MAIPVHPARPWPVPARPWVMHMSWHDLAFLHWPVEAAKLRPHIPAGLEIDEFDGTAWLGVVPFWMNGVRARCTPAIRGLHSFPELNVRTYVTHSGKRGVWFFSLDAASRIAVRTARRTFNLNYMDAKMSCDVESGRDRVVYSSHRTHAGASPAIFECSYEPIGEPLKLETGSLDEFLTERYCLYAATKSGTIFRADIAHVPWPLRQAKVSIVSNTMGEQIGIDLPREVKPEHARFSKVLHTICWLPEKLR